MPTFLALYQGRTIASARLVAVSADQDLVASVVERLLARPAEAEEDPIIHAIDHGRQQVLRMIKHGVSHAED